MRSLKHNVPIFNWCKNYCPRLARFSVIDVTKFVTKLFYLPVPSCRILKSTFFQLFPILTHVLITAAELSKKKCSRTISFKRQRQIAVFSGISNFFNGGAR